MTFVKRPNNESPKNWQGITEATTGKKVNQDDAQWRKWMVRREGFDTKVRQNSNATGQVATTQRKIVQLVEFSLNINTVVKFSYEGKIWILTKDRIVFQPSENEDYSISLKEGFKNVSIMTLPPPPKNAIATGFRPGDSFSEATYYATENELVRVKTFLEKPQILKAFDKNNPITCMYNGDVIVIGLRSGEVYVSGGSDVEFELISTSANSACTTIHYTTEIWPPTIFCGFADGTFCALGFQRDSKSWKKAELQVYSDNNAAITCIYKFGNTLFVGDAAGQVTVYDYKACLGESSTTSSLSEDNETFSDSSLETRASGDEQHERILSDTSSESSVNTRDSALIDFKYASFSCEASSITSMGLLGDFLFIAHANGVLGIACYFNGDWRLVYKSSINSNVIPKIVGLTVLEDRIYGYTSNGVVQIDNHMFPIKFYENTITRFLFNFKRLLHDQQWDKITELGNAALKAATELKSSGMGDEKLHWGKIHAQIHVYMAASALSQGIYEKALNHAIQCQKSVTVCESEARQYLNFSQRYCETANARLNVINKSKQGLEKNELLDLIKQETRTQRKLNLFILSLKKLSIRACYLQSAVKRVNAEKEKNVNIQKSCLTKAIELNLQALEDYKLLKKDKESFFYGKMLFNLAAAYANNHTTNTDLNNIIGYYESALRIFENHATNHLKAAYDDLLQTYLRLGNLYRLQGAWSRAYEMCARARNLLSRLDRIDTNIDSLEINLLVDQKQYDAAMQIVTTTISTLQERRGEELQVIRFSNLYKQIEGKKWQEMIDNADQFAQTSEDPDVKAKIYIQLAESYYYLGKYNLVLEYASKCENIVTKTECYLRFLIHVTCLKSAANRESASKNTKTLKGIITSCQSAKKDYVSQKINQPFLLGKINFNLGATYLDKGDLKKAVHYYKKTLKYFSESPVDAITTKLKLRTVYQQLQKGEKAVKVMNDVKQQISQEQQMAWLDHEQYLGWMQYEKVRKNIEVIQGSVEALAATK